MPRKSKAELDLAANVVGLPQKLPEPPEDLTEGQSALWHSIVSTKDASWWDSANLPLLRALVIHESQARLLDVEINAFEKEWLKDDAGLDRYERLGRARAVHTGKLAQLATKMRLTQQSRYGARQADTAARNGASNPSGAKKPWEV